MSLDLVQTPSQRRPLVAQFLKATTSNKRPVFEPFVVFSPSCLFRPESIFLEKEETSFFRALSLIPCNAEHKEVKVVNLTKTCPTIKELQQSFLKVKELCMLETSREFWGMDSTWLTSLEASRYAVMNKLLLLSYCWII